MASGSIHYKFKSAKTFDTLTFDGSFLAVSELKRLIVEKKGLGKDHACELVLVNAQDSSEYNDESALVWKNTSVIVKRVPSMKQSAVGSAIGSDVVKKVVYVAPPDVSQIPSKSQARRLQMNLNKISGVNNRNGEGLGDGTNADDPLASMAREQAQQWEQEKQAANLANAGRGGGRGGRGGGRGTRPDGPPGPGYICFKCNQGGHWIQDCPLAADTTVEIVRTKHAYGIPQTKLEATTGGILVAPTGESTQLVAAEDEFNKMFGFLRERGKDTLAIGAAGDENQTPLALGAGGGEDDAAAPGGDEMDEGEPASTAPPPLPPGFMPPLPPGAPPPNARKASELTAAAAPAMMDPAMMMMGAPGVVDPLDPMGIMSMDTSLEGLKKMAEDLKRQQELLASGAAADVNMMMIPGLMDLPPMMMAPAAPVAPLPPMPAAPPPPRVNPSGPPSFEDDDEDTVLTLAQGVDEDEDKKDNEGPVAMLSNDDDEDNVEREEDEDNPRRRSRAKPAAPPPPPVLSGAAAPPRGRPPPPPAHIPEDIQKQHEEALQAAAAAAADRQGRGAGRGEGRGRGRGGRGRDGRGGRGRDGSPPSMHRTDSRDRFGDDDADGSRGRKPPRRAIRPGGGARPPRADSRERRPRANSRDRRAPPSSRGDSRDRGGNSRKRKSDDDVGRSGRGDNTADDDNRRRGEGRGDERNNGRAHGGGDGGRDDADQHRPAKRHAGENADAGGDVPVPSAGGDAATAHPPSQARPRRARGGRNRGGARDGGGGRPGRGGGRPGRGGVFNRIGR